VESSSDAILLRSGETVIYANPAALRLFRANHPRELVGKRYLDLVHPDDRALSAERVKRNVDEHWVASPREHRVMALDGQTVHVESTGVPVHYRGETQIFGVFRDITVRRKADREREELETQLRQAQKMEAIGTLAGGIAHDFNNILSVIIGNSEILDLADAVNPSAKDSLNQVMAAAQRARQLVKQILAFSRHARQEKLVVNLKPIVKETIDFLRASLPATIQLKHYLDPKAGQILADPTQMQQVLMNLCTNASHAMETNGGVLEIQLGNVELAGEDAGGDSEAEAGRYLRLTVSDTGHGIDPVILPRIFEPYFTTKETGKGTGLGLSVVHGIVTSHGGTIKVYSEVGEGTSFKVYFPLAEDLTVSEAADPRPLPTGSERILFVDDEPGLANISREMLGHLGYAVETRTSPIEALEAFRANPQKFDLVITDMTMPNMTGLTLAKKVSAISPGIPVILCTGFSDQANEQRAHALGIRAFLLKPLLMRDLAEAVRKALDGPR
jgi:PAS domain S-box-containing protein